MGKNSKASLYVSNKLMKKYPCDISELLYPWCDQVHPRQESKKNIILYWGYLGAAVDFERIEELAADVKSNSLEIEIWLVGPVASEAKEPLDCILKNNPEIKLFSPRSLEDIPTGRVLCGIEFISKHFKNSQVLEFPNKAPRLLAYGIPLVYSGCQLLDRPFFLRYDGRINDVINNINSNMVNIQQSINDHFKTSNSQSVLDRVKLTIGRAAAKSL
ncbi:hypothetical protein [Diaphorobacter sp. JS3051]|uniref:hypothetical protein n=1 Tax=Diaphorobacter sp. JS3051 TaxID=2792224 RepID=UPI0018C95AC4|nr:hypothetical protein [Diaphorobacter sp. JS3051]QPN33193.1 hypothetical protein I3K84_21200 [Diaphorobacter sp. JS3051]